MFDTETLDDDEVVSNLNCRPDSWSDAKKFSLVNQHNLLLGKETNGEWWNDSDGC